MKKILFVHKHFYPDTPPYASMLINICKHLASKGNEVSVFTAQPSYNNNCTKERSSEKLFDLVRVKRIYLIFNLFNSKISQAIDMFYFPFRVFLEILLGKYDVVSVSTVPQVTLGFFSMVACKLSRTKLIYHCMDIHPEIGRLSGEFSNPLIYAFLNRLDTITVRNSDRVIVLSDDMVKSISRGGALYSKENITVVNNLSLESVDCSLFEISRSNELFKKPGSLRLIFAGNIGRFQGLEVLIEAFNQLDDNTCLELVFLGDGKMKSKIKELSCHPRITFFPHVDVATAREVIGDSDFGIVSLSPKIVKYAFPSKTSTYLDLGIPIFGVVEDSSLADMIIDNDIGIVSNNSSSENILSNLRSIESGDIDISLLKENTVPFYENNFGNGVILSEWESIIRDI
ncbi:glycosyltransferase family 4 protein [Vibrio gigantis]|uniref:glycosyltransferase family 4 protein n=1 Tax=Vibrio gigantis TaxID=296199 RepID=UPI003D11B9FE